MVSEAERIWDDLAEPWRHAFGEAWTSWCHGSLGIGAVLVDPATNEVVSSGRNRTTEARTEPGVLAGNFMAHAEMNAFATLDRFKADGLHLFTTVEPCLMCAATAVFLHVDTTFFAATDPFFAGVENLWDHHDYSVRHRPTVVGPVADPLASFSTILQLTRLDPANRSFDVVGEHFPKRAALARQVMIDGTLTDVASVNGSTVEALATLLPLLE